METLGNKTLFTNNFTNQSFKTNTYDQDHQLILL